MDTTLFPNAHPVQMISISRSSTFRLTAALGVAYLCGIAFLLGLIYVLTERELVARIDEILHAETALLIRVPVPQLPGRVRAAVASSPSHLTWYALIDGQGRILAGNFVPSHIPRPGRVHDLLPDASGQSPLRVLVSRTADGSSLVVARDITPIEDLRHRVVAILVTSGIVTTLAVLVAAIMLSIGPLRRIRKLTTLAARIAAGELTVRMPVTPRGDELDVIALTINAMVEEIARLLEQVKHATDAIAHDLRTPLARARSRLESIRRQIAHPPPSTATLEGAAVASGLLAVPSNRPENKFEATLDIATAELDTVLARFSALLRIAELEAANRKAGFGALDPMNLIAEVCELYGPLAEEQDVRLQLSGEWGLILRGDAKLLFEAVSNLVENAIKFAVSGGDIMISVSAAAGMMTLSVRDNGPGIPIEERSNVLRRFYRSTTARHIPGSGLGLSLVAAIVHLHGFSLDLIDASPGLDVQISGPIDHAKPTRSHVRKQD